MCQNQNSQKGRIAMRKPIFIGLLALSLGIAGCGHRTFHHGSMPDPGPYMIHYYELDADGDDAVTLDVFRIAPKMCSRSLIRMATALLTTTSGTRSRKHTGPNINSPGWRRPAFQSAFAIHAPSHPRSPSDALLCSSMISARLHPMNAFFWTFLIIFSIFWVINSTP